MDFEKLLEPYKENGRTIEKQIQWLTGKLIPRNFIDQAVLRVFGDLENGTTFTDGNALDQFLLKVARDLYTEEVSKQAKELESFMTNFKQDAVKEYVKVQQGSVWKRLKAVVKPV